MRATFRGVAILFGFGTRDSCKETSQPYKPMKSQVQCDKQATLQPVRPPKAASSNPGRLIGKIRPF